LRLLCVMEIPKWGNHCRTPVDGSLNLKDGRPVVKSFHVAHPTPVATKILDTANSFQPYYRDRVFLLGDPLRHVLLSTIPGSDEKDKLNSAFKSAPPWLIWFTFADYTAKLLDLDLPDLSSVSGFERTEDIFHTWWGLPKLRLNAAPGLMALMGSRSSAPT
jgi:hypothetical protein